MRFPVSDIQGGRGLRALGALLGCSILAATLWADYSNGRDQLIRQTDARANLAVHDAATQLDDFIRRVSMIPITTASRQQVLGNNPDPMMVEYLRSVIAKVPDDEVYGIYIAYEDMKWSDRNSMPWMDRRNAPEMTVVHYDYHAPDQDWYNGAKTDGRLHITEPYFDAGGSDINMVSVTHPVIADDGHFVGVAGADLSLELIQKIVDRIETNFWYATGETEADHGIRHAYLVSRKGLVVTHPDSGLVLSRDSPGARVESLPDGKATLAAPNGSAKVDIGAQQRRIFWATSELTGWKLILNVSEEEVMRPIRALAVKSLIVAAVGLGAMLGLLLLVANRTTGVESRPEPAARR